MTENCKYFRHEPDYTPNNFDIYMDYTGIPSNIPKENANDLKNRLQKTMPLTKKIHLNLETETIQKNK